MKKILIVLILLIVINLYCEEINDNQLIVKEQIMSIQDNYIFQKGDKITIEVMEHSEFTKDVQILPDGSIEYPIIGRLKVEGMSVSLLRSVIRENLSPYVPIPIVTIYVTSIYGEKLNIIGYVNNPGSYQIYDSLDLIDAIAMAGGLVNIRKVKKVKILRKDGTSINIKMSKIWFSTNMVNASEYKLMLHAGDSLIIPPPIEFNWSMLTAFISLASLGLSVYSVMQ